MAITVQESSGNTLAVSVSDGTSTTFTTTESSISFSSPVSSSVEVLGKGPKGDTGATGATGATGPQGPAGSDGTSPNAFTTLAVAGQDNVVADATDDTLTLAAGSNVTITTNASSDTVTIASTDTNTQLSTEAVQDIVGGMFTGNTETRISATYQDADGTIDLEVDAIPVDLTSDGAGTIHVNNVPTLNQSTTGNAATATALATARAINGVNFDGTAPITVTAAGSTLSDEVPVSKGGTGATSFTSNAVLTGNSTSAIQAESALTYDATADTLQLTSSTGGYPRIELKSEANVTGGQRFVFIKDRGAAPADGDTLGVIRWEGEDSGQNATAYAQIFGKISDTTDGSEGGHLALQVASHDGEMTVGLEIVDGDAEDEIDVNIGSGDASVTTINGSAVLNRKFSVTGDTDGTFQGDVVYFGGTTSMTTGALYHYKSDGTWELADADAAATCDGLLGIALGAASDTNGVLLRGMVTVDHDTGAVGDVLFVSTTAGDITATAPSGNADIVRVVGYCLHASNGQIWFNPDGAFVEVTA